MNPNPHNIELIKEKKHSIIIEQKGIVIYTSSGFGLWPLYHFYKRNNPYFPVQIYDKVTGTGAARFILAMGNVNYVYSTVITKKAYELLKQHNIEIGYDEMVESILNKQKNDLCPVEKLSLEHEDFSNFMKSLDVFYLNIKDVYEKSFLNE